ncbi:MAG TPA: PQQ-dependent sugar dehydrogenase [Candidatus Limnocylindrales bacterium]|nr:PQQ-dependent sugar dehydrogenase [Candidatus Limnocylindrales bacterium]
MRGLPGGGARPLLAVGMSAVLVACTGTPTASPSPSASLGFSPSPTASGVSRPPTTSTSRPTPVQTASLAGLQISLQRFVSGLQQPVGIVAPGDGSGRLFVVEREGRIRVIGPTGDLQAAPFLDIRDLVGSGYVEQGLLGLAFSSTYASDGRFFVDYTDDSSATGNTIVAEYRRQDATHADPSSARALLKVAQPFQNHNGGQLAFGPDGDLYVALGDGGSGGDPGNRAQDLGVLLGKILRLDVRPGAASGGLAYGIPADNPFAGRTAARAEIWAYGLRNPWRFSFDRSTGDLIIGDVGQGAHEEVDFLPRGRGGQDLGWRIMEGTSCYPPASGCRRTGLTLPVATYDHGTGDCAVIGGFVDRGTDQPALAGIYLMGDECSGRIRGFVDAAARTAAAAGRQVSAPILLDTSLTMSSFGQGDDGNLYVCDLAGGGIYRVVASRT